MVEDKLSRRFTLSLYQIYLVISGLKVLQSVLEERMSGVEGSEYFETDIMNEYVKELIGIFEDEREITVCEGCNTEYPAEILQKVDGRLICAACSYYGH